MFVVTGGAGFIGSHLVRHLLGEGHEVLVVDDRPVTGLEGRVRQESAAAFAERLADGPGALAGVRAVLHQGACSDTTEMDEAYLERVNVRYSIDLVRACRAAGVACIYASSASVYGPRTDTDERPDNVEPLNPYAASKAAVDAAVAPLADEPGSQVVGLRYFNVYGPGEHDKGPMSSLVHQIFHQLEGGGDAVLFGAGEGAGPGEHRRDFVWVADVVAVVRWFLDHPEASGTFNCGTGVSRTFNDLAAAVIAARGGGRVAYRPFPPSLVGRYQAETRADLGRLRAVGCDVRFSSLEAGVAATVDAMVREGCGP